ncbi:MAG: hypothetical protein VB141_11445 [Burkholderia gladioli]
MSMPVYKTTILVWDGFIRGIYLYSVPIDAHHLDRSLVFGQTREDANRKFSKMLGGIAMNGVCKFHVGGEYLDGGCRFVPFDKIFSGPEFLETFIAPELQNIPVIGVAFLDMRHKSPELDSDSLLDFIQYVSRLFARFYELDLRRADRAILSYQVKCPS